MFSGTTYNATLDGPRLKRQFDLVFDKMADGQWHTLSDLAQHSGGTEAAVSARVRDFRKDSFGGHTVERERVPGKKGLWRYRLILRKDLLAA